MKINSLYTSREKEHLRLNLAWQGRRGAGVAPFKGKEAARLASGAQAGDRGFLEDCDD